MDTTDPRPSDPAPVDPKLSGGALASRVRDLVDVVWRRGDLDALPDFWTQDCVNHAAPTGADTGLAALRAYHAAFAGQFAAFVDVTVEITQQLEDGDRVATHLLTRGRHVGTLQGIVATGTGGPGSRSSSPPGIPRGWRGRSLPGLGRAC